VYDLPLVIVSFVGLCVLIDLLKAKKIVYREINELDLSWPDKPEMIILNELTWRSI
jgi:hypothetical protein